MRTTGDEDVSGLLMSSHVALRAKQMQVLDLERNILQVWSFLLSGVDP